MTSRIAACLCAMLLAVGVLHAQRTAQASAEISGVVMVKDVNAVAAHPLARVLVTLSSPALTGSQTSVTDELGRFTFRSLPAGRFTLAATRAPYVKTNYGATRPGRAGTPIELAAGQRVADVTIPLVRGAAVSGMIRNAAGDPQPGLRVTLDSLDGQPDALRAPAVTDDRGMYRAFGLAPGRYIVRVTGDAGNVGLVALFADDEMDKLLAALRRGPVASISAVEPALATLAARERVFTYAPVFHPGTADPDEAEVLSLAEGEERAGVDIVQEMFRATAIFGRVSMPSGPPPAVANIIMTRQTQRSVASATAPATAFVDSTGNFRFPNVLPGNYRVSARAVAAGGAVLWATTDIAPSAESIPNAVLMLQPALHVSGQIVFDAGSRTPPDPSTIRFTMNDPHSVWSSAPTGVGRGGRLFDIGNVVPGSYTVSASLTDAGWWLRSVVIDGRDVLDFPLDVVSADISGAVATFTDKHTELSGVLSSAANAPAPEYFVVVLPTDQALWRAGSRRVKFMRPSTDGRYVVRDLPPGEYVIAAAIDVEPKDLIDTAFMGSLLASGARITLGDGEVKRQDLKIGG